MSASLKHSDILSVRDASRRMVRDLGFMQQTLAGTDLSPSAVHAVIEIGAHGKLTAQKLAQILLLDKSTVSRLLARLGERGLVIESANDEDGRSKMISLSETGSVLLHEIDRFANLQVGRALHSLNADKRQIVIEGLRTYAGALAQMHADGQPSKESAPVIVEGFRPGAIGRIAEMHGVYYSREWSFPPPFEARVAAGLADFVPRLGRDGNQIWLVLSGSDIRGSAAIDGEDLGNGKAHLRWVIIEDNLRGTGIGRRLVAEAMNFCDQRGFAETHLWTFKGLDAARHLYESFGFVLAEESLGNQWGTEVVEQRFVRRRQ